MTRSERIKKAGDALATWVDRLGSKDDALVADERMRGGIGRAQTWREATATDAQDPIGPGSHFFKCECQADAVEAGANTEDYAVNLAFWRQAGIWGRGTIRERLRRAWRVLWGSSPYANMVMLHPATARELADTLVGMADHIEADTDENHKTPEPE